jgi:argininosuccinate synthase
LDPLPSPTRFRACLGVLDVRLGDGGDAPVTTWPVETVDARERFRTDVLTRAIKANAVYQGGYHLSAALSRPVLAAVCAERLASTGATTLVHGLAGNDQLRFEMGVQALAPDTTIVPVAKLLGSRNDANDGSYTVSDNLWGRSTESAGLGDPGAPPPADVVDWTAPVKQAETVVVGFEQGVPVSLDGLRLSLGDIVRDLGAVVTACGAGWYDLVEDGFVGLKTRAVYSSPAAAALVEAHRDLERFVCTRAQNRFKALVDQAWTELVYDGFWFDEQRASLDAYVDHVNQWVTGEVTLLIQPGGVRAVARTSPYALYDVGRAVYRFGQDFAAADTTAIAATLSTHMRASAVRRGEN